MLVQNELKKLGLNLKSIKLGEVTLSSEPTTQELFKLEKALLALGFEIIDDKRNRTVERIKNIIIDLIHHQYNGVKTNLPMY